MFAALLALALTNLKTTRADAERPFLSFYASWTGGLLAAIAVLALLVSFANLPTITVAGEGVYVVLRAIGIGLALLVAPFLIGAAWLLDLLLGWLPEGADLPDPPPPVDLDPPEDEEDGPPGWVTVLGYVLRSGAVLLFAALVVGLFWGFLRRRTRRAAADDEVREDAGVVPGGRLADLRAMLSGALAGLPGWSRGVPADAIGKLYVSVLKQSADRGVVRPAAATPLEFAPALHSHWGSPVVASISAAYSAARYGRVQPSDQELERLRADWEELRRHSAQQ
jgi:hypothetical protein